MYRTRKMNLLFLFAVSFVSFVAAQDGTDGDGDGSASACTAIAGGRLSTRFDLLVLKLSWPKTACDAMLDGCAQHKVKDRFMVHGMWPMYKDGAYPVFCRDSKFTMSAVDDLKNVLHKYWADLHGSTERLVLGDSGRKLWKEQWETHGVCLSKDEHAYFHQALTLRKALPVESYLWSANIYPSNDKAFHAADMLRAISFGLGGVQPLLICSPPRTSSTDNSDCYLQEVQICLNKDRVPIDCPAGVVACARKNGITCDHRMVRFPSAELVGKSAPPKPPGGAFVFLLYVCLFVFFYIVGGCVFNIQIRQKRFGLAAFPHLKFWRDELPTLVSDGISFAVGGLHNFFNWVQGSIAAHRNQGNRNIFT